MSSDSSHPVVIYDGDCAFCRESVERLKRRDVAGVFEFTPWQADHIEDRFPQLRSASLDEGMRLIEPDGSVYVGADAAHRIARELPRWRRFAWLYRLPGMSWLARKVYAWIAARRHRLGRTCEHGACELHDV